MLPVLYRSEYLILYSYPLCIGLAWGIGWQWVSHHLASAWRYWLFVFFFTALFVTSWAGAKLLFLINVSDEHRALLLPDSSFWLGGGFVFLGGVAGALLAVAAFYPFLRVSERATLPRLATPIPLAHAVGRVGCFLAGCCYGSETSGWWGVHLHGANRHPVQLWETAGLVAVALLLKKLEGKNLPATFALACYLAAYGMLRFILEFFRGDAIRGFWGPLSTSQWLSLLMIISGLYLFNRLRPTVSR